jgi:hypothetical protein
VLTGRAFVVGRPRHATGVPTDMADSGLPTYPS